MNKLKQIYQSIKQFIMANKTKKAAQAFPKDEKGWKKFSKDKKITEPFFVVEGSPLVRRTSDGKAYTDINVFVSDGGTTEKIQTIKLK